MFLRQKEISIGEMNYALCIMHYELCIMHYELKDLIINLIKWKRQNKNFLKTHSAN